MTRCGCFGGPPPPNDRPRSNPISGFSIAGFVTTRENPNRALRVNWSEPKRFPLQILADKSKQRKATLKKSAKYTLAISGTGPNLQPRCEQTETYPSALKEVICLPTASVIILF